MGGISCSLLSKVNTGITTVHIHWKLKGHWWGWTQVIPYLQCQHHAVETNLWNGSWTKTIILRLKAVHSPYLLRARGLDSDWLGFKLRLQLFLSKPVVLLGVKILHYKLEIVLWPSQDHYRIRGYNMYELCTVSTHSSTQKWKTITKNFKKYFYNNPDQKRRKFFEDTML